MDTLRRNSILLRLELCVKGTQKKRQNTSDDVCAHIHNVFVVSSANSEPEDAFPLLLLFAMEWNFICESQWGKKARRRGGDFLIGLTTTAFPFASFHCARSSLPPHPCMHANESLNGTAVEGKAAGFQVAKRTFFFGEKLYCRTILSRKSPETLFR